MAYCNSYFEILATRFVQWFLAAEFNKKW